MAEPSSTIKWCLYRLGEGKRFIIELGFEPVIVGRNMVREASVNSSFPVFFYR